MVTGCPRYAVVQYGIVQKSLPTSRIPAAGKYKPKDNPREVPVEIGLVEFSLSRESISDVVAYDALRDVGNAEDRETSKRMKWRLLNTLGSSASCRAEAAAKDAPNAYDHMTSTCTISGTLPVCRRRQ